MARARSRRSLAFFCVALVRIAVELSAAQAADADAPVPSAWAAALGEADRRFVAGDLAGALEILQPICSTSERPECAFALGAVQHGLGHCEEARVHYRRYRELAPQGEHSAEVQAALEEVETRCGNAPLAPAAVAVPSASRPVSEPAAGNVMGRVASGAVASGAVAEPASAPSVPLVRVPDPLNRSLVVGSLALSGASAATSVIFGILAARSARHCRRAVVYDRSFIDECESKGPRYQGLWQGFAVASGSFLGIGATLWWLDERSNAALGVAGAGVPTLQYQRSF
jgi:hypothetical protein